MNITLKTPLKTIKNMVLEDFGIVINNDQAKEIRSSVTNGAVVWTKDHYISARQSDEIARMDEFGVRVRTGNRFYTKADWNAINGEIR